MTDWQSWLLAALAVLFLGLSKAGFGGGLGMLTTPLCALAFPPREALGLVLPLLCAGDLFSLAHYWRKWDARNLKYLLPGAALGVVIGVQCIGHFSPRQLNLAIGALAVAFVVFHLAREWIFHVEGTFAPNHAFGIPCGIAAGVTSSFAHGAGPVVSMFLVPQRLPKEIFVGTNVLLFFWINWIKVPFFAAQGVITSGTLVKSLWFLPLVPLGVWLGVWLNRRFSETWFSRVVLVTLLLSGLQLMFNFRLGR
ncbi:MAG: sulfite exporter TauE/SafE family protein [Limisphaerales bacterium]